MFQQLDVNDDGELNEEEFVSGALKVIIDDKGFKMLKLILSIIGCFVDGSHQWGHYWLESEISEIPFLLFLLKKFPLIF